MIRIGKDLDGQYLEFLKEKNLKKVQRKVEVTILETDPGGIQGILVSIFTYKGDE